MTPAESFGQLGAERQRQVHLSLCEDALETWTSYVSARAPLRYADSVVGMRHDVDVGLPADALRSARTGADLANVESRYREPIAAMQDDDLTLQDPVKFAYYAIYNCFRKHACGEDIDPWLIVNQALSSNDNKESWVPRLMRAMATAI
jgi:hypothetical protein